MKYKIACSLLAVVTLGAGCGEVPPAEPDAAGPDADASVADKPVKVRALTIGASGNGNGLPDPSAIVIFSAPDSTIVKQGLVNQQGEAESLVPAGGLVQTIQIAESTATNRRAYIMNFHGVKPGDVLNAGLSRTLPNLQGASTTMNGAFTATANYNHEFWSECGSFSSATSPVALTLRDGCRGDTVDVLAIETSTLTPPAQPRFVLTSTPYVNGGTFTVPNTWTTMANFVLTLTNVPEDITNFSLSRATLFTAAASATVATQSAALGDPGAGTVVGSVPYPQGVGKRAVVTATLTKAGAGAPHRLEVLTSEVVGAQGIDYNDLPLPWLGALTSVPAERKLSWTETGAGTPDLRIAAATYRYVRDNITYDIFIYDFAAPSATPELVFPTLPTAYAEFDPAQQATAVAPTLGILALVDQSNVEGYDGARGLGVGMISSPGTTDQFAGQSFRRRTTIINTRLR